MNINTVLLIIIILIIVSPRLRKWLNSFITKLFSYVSILLTWTGIILSIIALLIFLIRWGIPSLKGLYVKNPTDFKTYGVISLLVIVPYIIYNFNPKFKERIKNIKVKSQVKLTFWWAVIIISITVGFISLIGYFYLK